MLYNKFLYCKKKKKKKKRGRNIRRLRGSACLPFFTYMSLKDLLRFLTLRNSIHSLILSPRKLTFPYKLSFSPLSGFNDLSKLPVWSMRKKPYYFYLELFVFVFLLLLLLMCSYGFQFIFYPGFMWKIDG